MAISESKILDLLWKKLGYGVTKTDDANRKSPSNESISSPLIIRGDKIWVESDQIPAVIPQTSSSLVEVHSAYLSNLIQCTEDNTSTPLRTWKTNQTDWIPVEFGPTYQVKVYVDNPGAFNPTATGTRLFADGTGSDEWYFDYSAGVLHFIGDTLPAQVTTGKVIYISGARYIGTSGLANLDLSGTGSAVQGELPASQTFIYDGSTSVYTLSTTPTTPDALDVYVNDVLQRPGEVFTIAGDQLTLTEAPLLGSELYIKYRYPYASVIDFPNESIENRHLDLVYVSNQYTGTGSQQIFNIEAGHTQHDILVILNGSILPPSAYTVSGSTLTLLNPPNIGAQIDIRYLPV